MFYIIHNSKIFFNYDEIIEIKNWKQKWRRLLKRRILLGAFWSGSAGGRLTNKWEKFS